MPTDTMIREAMSDDRFKPGQPTEIIEPRDEYIPMHTNKELYGVQPQSTIDGLKALKQFNRSQATFLKGITNKRLINGK